MFFVPSLGRRNEPRECPPAAEDFLRFSLGDGSVVAGFEEAVTGMKPGGVRRVIVPVELGYPGGDYNKVGPKPSTFSVREEKQRERGKGKGMMDGMDGRGGSH